MTKYQQTKEQCESKIKGVCPGCGGQVTAIETVDNSNQPTYWSGCEECSFYTHAVPLEVYEMARLLVEEGTLGSNRFKILNSSSPGEKFVWLSGDTRKASEIVSRIRFLLGRQEERELKDLEDMRIPSLGRVVGHYRLIRVED